MTELRRLAAIVSADIAGYSRLMGQDESGTLAALKALRQEVIDPAIASHGGRIVKTTGDGLLLEFPSVVNAVRCAVEVQTAMADRTGDVPEDQRIAFRIGINIGDIIVEGDDIFGDGVNVAARLQELSAPGGICIASRVHEDVRDRLDTAFNDGGTQTLKNIARPVQVWRWQPGTMVARVIAPMAAPAVTALPLPDKPSIAVLPFQNMSGDPEQEYFVDGLVEDIITGLSRFKALFVIARNSSFAYKGNSPDIRQVGHELGVRYVMEGSVRKGGSRLRITGQLIDASDGTHLWADRFEGALEDVFELQDRVTTSVVTVIAPRVLQAEIERVRGKPTANLKAYDLLLQAQALMRLAGRNEVDQALRLFRQAVELDPTYARALALLSICCFRFISQGFGHRDDPQVSDLVQVAQKAVALDASDSDVVALAAQVLALPGGDMDTGLGLAEKAIALNPNSGMAFRTGAMLHGYLGQAEKAVDYAQRADRLSPFDSGWGGNVGYVIAYFGIGDHEKVLRWTARILREQPHVALALRYRAASLALLGRVEEAHEIVARILKRTPGYTIEDVRRHFEFDMHTPFKMPGVTESLYRGLRLAGLPE
jgi:adenylate cyclase